MKGGRRQRMVEGRKERRKERRREGSRNEVEKGGRRMAWNKEGEGGRGVGMRWRKKG